MSVLWVLLWLDLTSVGFFFLSVISRACPLSTCVLASRRWWVTCWPTSMHTSLTQPRRPPTSPPRTDSPHPTSGWVGLVVNGFSKWLCVWCCALSPLVACRGRSLLNFWISFITLWGSTSPNTGWVRARSDSTDAFSVSFTSAPWLNENLLSFIHRHGDN